MQSAKPQSPCNCRRRQTALDACWALPRMLPNGVARSELIAVCKEANVPSYQGARALRSCNASCCWLLLTTKFLVSRAGASCL